MSIKKASSPSVNLFSHHAYLLLGPRGYWSEILSRELKKILNLDRLASSPDVWWQDYDSFGIKDAHALIDRQAKKSFGELGRFFVLGIYSMTPEAQNALLKTFEEPTLTAHFFIIARTAEMFLPTFRSRLVIEVANLPVPSTTSVPPNRLAKVGQNEVGSRVSGDLEVGLQVSPKSDFEIAKKFLNLDYPDRLDFIQKEFLPARGGGKGKDKSKSEIIDFIIELEKALRAKIEMNQITKDEELALHELAKCQRYLQNPRSSNRLILEHISLVIPN